MWEESEGRRDGGDASRDTLLPRLGCYSYCPGRPGRVEDEILVSVISKCHKMDKIAIDTFNSVEIMLKLLHTLWVKLEQG